MPNYFFHHIHLTSKDPLKTAEFYEKKLGARKVSVDKLADGRTSVSLDLSGVSIRVIHPRSNPLVPGMLPPDGCGLEHLGIRTDNLEEAVADLKANGARFVQEITPFSPKARISFCVLPENVLIELLEVTP